MKHYNVAIFVPHNGCPFKCSFCDQVSITGKNRQPDENDVKSAVEIALSSLKDRTKNAEIAFFGGSFTAIKREYMIRLLEATRPYIDSFYGIRISTRPDYINDEILSVLRSYKVTSIELGAQSMCDDVLESNRRGHTAEDVVNASLMIKEYGFSLGLQMMTGLYGSDDEKDIYTAQEFIKLRPDTVRIYPTIVMKNTELGRKYLKGEYTPQTLDDAVDLCARLLKLFNNEKIEVIRLGLHDSETLSKDKLSGPYHPSFRELCESKLLLDTFYEKISDLNIKDFKITVTVNPKSISKFIGNKRSNINRLSGNGYDITLKTDENVDVYDVRIS